MKMSHCVEIIVFYLENDKWLLHLVEKNDTSDDDLYNEARLKYEFVRMNNIISIYQRIPIENVLLIDYHVKLYMSYYGIENVRGGIYKQTFFDSKLVDRLHDEIFFDFYSEFEENQEISSIVTSLKAKTRIDTTRLYNEIMRKINIINDAEQIITNVKYYYKDNVMRPIDRDLATNIDRIIFSVECGGLDTKTQSTINSVSLKEYEDTIMIFPFIYDNFKKLKQHTVYTLNPEIVISSAVHILKPIYCEEEYHTFDTEYVEMSLKILNYYKYMTNCIINRCDEYDFDIQHYNNQLTKSDFHTMRYLEDYM